MSKAWQEGEKAVVKGTSVLKMQQAAKKPERKEAAENRESGMSFLVKPRRSHAVTASPHTRWFAQVLLWKGRSLQSLCSD